MKTSSFNPKLLTGLLFCLICILCITWSSRFAVAQVVDTSNPSELSERDYANGSKRAADAAKRVIPRMTKEMEGTGLAVGNPIFIRVIKLDRKLEMWMLHKGTKKYQLFKTYNIAGMSGGVGPKVAEGDMQAPEGFYDVSRGALNPQSRFHLSFNLGYPNRYDLAHGRTGYALMIHGNEVSAGCLAMTDYYVEEIYTLCAAALKRGQASVSVHIFPFRMTEANLEKTKGNQWYGFWRNLKVGYDAFEKTHVPPKVNVSGRMYNFR